MKNYYLRFYEPERYKETIKEAPTTSQSLDGNKSYMPDLPWKEYARFIKGWDILVLAADLTTICGIIGLIDEVCIVSFFQIWRITLLFLIAIVVPIKSDNDRIFCLQLLSKILTCYRHFN